MPVQIFHKKIMYTYKPDIHNLAEQPRPYYHLKIS